MATLAPLAASFRAIPLPIPRELPVISACFPFRDISTSLSVRSNETQDQRPRDLCNSPRRRGLEELRRNQSPESECGDNSNGKADDDRLHPLANDQFKHICGLRAQGHAHADFAGALLDAVRDRAINSNGREEERDPGEYA